MGEPEILLGFRAPGNLAEGEPRWPVMRHRVIPNELPSALTTACVRLLRKGEDAPRWPELPAILGAGVARGSTSVWLRKVTALGALTSPVLGGVVTEQAGIACSAISNSGLCLEANSQD
jgi:hypothetical protein